MSEGPRSRRSRRGPMASGTRIAAGSEEALTSQHMIDASRHRHLM